MLIEIRCERQKRRQTFNTDAIASTLYDATRKRLLIWFIGQSRQVIENATIVEGNAAVQMAAALANAASVTIGTDFGLYLDESESSEGESTCS